MPIRLANRFIGLRLSLFLLGTLLQVNAHALDFRLLVEGDGTSINAEQQSLKARLLEQAIQRLPEDARSGLWAYTDNTERMVNFGPAGPLWKQVATIHARNLSGPAKQADLESALDAALWDLLEPERGHTHLLLVANTGLRLDSAQATADSRTRVLNKLGNQFASRGVTVHTVAFAPITEQHDVDLLRQLSALSGGLHRVISSDAEIMPFLSDVMRLTQASVEPRVDARGRFQVPPQTEALSAVWQRKNGPEPSLITPQGKSLNRRTPIPDGRWLVAEGFEMVTLNNPAPGWWQLGDAQPEHVGVYGDLNIKVSGLHSPVVPSEETSALVAFYSWGQRVDTPALLELLDVRATLIHGNKREPMPVEEEGSGYRVQLMNLDDGAYELEVAALAPTFQYQVTVPFEVNNPLRVEVRANEQGGAAAFLSFSHPAVDYVTVRTTIKQRKPPALGKLIPGEKLPGGVWRLPITEDTDFVKISFALSGNYLNGEGFFLKTKPVSLQLPLQDGTRLRFHFDAKGEQLKNAPQDEPESFESLLESSPPDASATQAPAAEPVPEPAAEAVPEPPASLPIWFVLVISLISVALGGAAWWFFKPDTLNLPGMDEQAEPQPAS